MQEEEIEDDMVEYLIDQIDTNNDGKIDLMEFLNCMLNRYTEEKKQLKEFQTFIDHL